MVIVVKNLQKEQLKITLKNGLLIVPKDSNYQTLVTIQDLVINVKNQESRFEIEAMCTEQNKNAPNEALIYKTINTANPQLCKLTDLLNTRKYNNYQAQNAIWVLTNGQNLANVNGFDKTCRDSLLDVLCDITKKERPKAEEMESYIYNPSSQNYKVKVSGRINFMLYKSAHVSVGLYNLQQVQVRDLVQETINTSGEQSIYYAFDNSIYKDKEYIVKTYVNEKLLFEKRQKMSIRQ